MAPVCGTCHKPVEGTMRGYLDHVTLKSSAMQLNLGAGVEIIKFDPKLLKVIDAGQSKKAEYLRDVKKGHEIRIEFVETDGVKTATLVSLKGPIQVSQEKLVGYEAVEKLVALGPEKGAYALIDSRPAVRFQEGTIPTAVNLPFPAFDKFIDRLPQDKDRLCGVLLSGRHVHDESQLSQACGGHGLHERERLKRSRRLARVDPEKLRRDFSCIRQ